MMKGSLFFAQQVSNHDRLVFAMLTRKLLSLKARNWSAGLEGLATARLCGRRALSELWKCLAAGHALTALQPSFWSG